MASTDGTSPAQTPATVADAVPRGPAHAPADAPDAGPSAAGPSAGLSGARLGATLLVLSAAALVLAARSAVATAVVGVILFGVLHNVFAVRYLGGRFSRLLGRRLVEVLFVLASAIALCRLLVPVVGTPAQVAEVVLGYGVVGVGVGFCVRGPARWVVWAALVPATVVSALHPAVHLLVLGFVHLLAPVAFLWEWSARLSPGWRGRLGFRASALAWSLAVPALVLGGALDRVLSADPGPVRSIVGQGLSVLASAAPPGEAQTVVGLRFLTVVALLQAMAYVVWVWFLPRHAPDATTEFEARLPWLTAARVWALAFIVASFFAVLFAFGFVRGRVLYSALSAYGAYLEVAVLLALVAGWRRGSEDDRTPTVRPEGTGTDLEHGPVVVSPAPPPTDRPDAVAARAVHHPAA